MAGIYARFSVHVLGIVNQTLGERRPNRVLATLNSLLRAIEAVVCLPSSHAEIIITATSRSDRGSCGWRAVTQSSFSCSRGWWRRQNRGIQSSGGQGEEASEKAELARASSACRHVGRGERHRARTLLAEPRPAGHEETWTMLVSKQSPEDHTVIPLRPPQALQR